MKKYLKIIIILFSAVFLVTYSAMALPFSSSGYVNPNFNNSWDPTTSSGTALFEIYIEEDWASANRAWLEFENDIFNLSGIQASDFNVLNPAGWTTLLSPGTNGYEFSISLAGTPATSTNDPVRISFDYVLLGADRYYNASEGISGGWAWDEGQGWAVTYGLADTTAIDIFGIPATSGGSTAPVPEPATMLLMGTGLACLATIARRRKVKKA